MESNYIVIYDTIDESKLVYYESILKACISTSENNNFSLFFINNDKNSTDLLCNNETLLEGLVSGKIDIYNGNNIKEFLKNSFCIFYFLDYKDNFFTINLEEIIGYNKFILHKYMDKYKALFNVLNDLSKNSNHKFNQNNFLNHYDKLNGSNELNIIFNKFKNKDNTNKDNINKDNNICEQKKIKLIKKVNLSVIKEFVDNKNDKEENDKEKNVNKEIFKKNINIEIKKKNDLIMNHVYTTYYNHTNHNITNEIQIKCMIENIKNNLFNKYIIFNIGNKDFLINYFKNELNTDYMNHIIFVEVESKINKIIDYLNTNYLGDIIYLSRSDILIPIQNEIKNIQFKLLENNYIYAISRIERRLDGSIFKEQSFNNLLYSHLQDLYIFVPSINIDIKNNNEIYNQLDFYESNFEILFNKLLESSGYFIINDTINCKILRIMCSNDINERHIMKKCSINYKDYNCSYIAENSILNKFSLENYLNNLDLNEEEIYLVKQYIFKLFIKKNNII